MAAPNDWRDALLSLAAEIRRSTRQALLRAVAARDRDALTRKAGRGAGDVTFGLDVPAEEAVDRWLEERARRGPLSLLTEDRGWRHLGPAAGGVRELADFDHGGPRIAVDPVDGTRSLMYDLRSAWTVVALAPPGPAVPRLEDMTAGLVAEIPTSRAALYRTFWAAASGCRREERSLHDGALLADERVQADGDDRVDCGYFSFFRYQPLQRPALARLEARFFERLEREEGADLRSVYEDQYLSNAGQLVLLLSGVYRMVVDARALLARRSASESAVTSKPYDVAGAIVCARAAGAALTAADGSPLSFPIDTETPVDFAGYANEATRRRMEPHWLAALREDG